MRTLQKQLVFSLSHVGIEEANVLPLISEDSGVEPSLSTSHLAVISSGE